MTVIQIKVINMDGEDGANSEDPEEAQSAAWVIDLGEANGRDLFLACAVG